MHFAYPLAGGLALAILATGCSPGGGSSTPPLEVPDLALASPPATFTTVDAPEIAIQMERRNLVGAEVQVLGGPSLPAKPFGATLLIGRVPLLPGQNELRLVTRTATASKTTLLTIVNQGTLPAPQWTTGERMLHGLPANIELALDPVRPLGGAVEFLLDWEGDGRFDEVRPTAARLSREFTVEGNFLPVALIREASGLLVPTRAASARLTVLAEPLGPPQTMATALAGFGDLVVDHRHRRVAVIDGQRLRVFDYDGTQVASLQPEGVQFPHRLGVTDGGDLLVTDSVRHRITRLVFADGYQPDESISPDGSFGGLGVAPGNFQSLSGVCFVRYGLQELLVASDEGRSSLQLFSLLGDHKGYRPHATAPQPAAPRSIRSLGAHLVAIEGDAAVCRDVIGAEVWRVSPPGGVSHLATAPDGRLLVTSIAGGAVLLLDAEGHPVATLGVPDVTAAAIGHHDSGVRLFIVVGTTLQRREVFLTPQDDAPRAAVQAFLGHLGRGDFAAAATLCDPIFGKRVAALSAGTAAANALAARIATVSDTAMVQRDIDSAVVRVSRTGTDDHAVFLTRIDGVWLIKLF